MEELHIRQFDDTVEVTGPGGLLLIITKTHLVMRTDEPQQGYKKHSFLDLRKTGEFLFNSEVEGEYEHFDD